MLDVFNRYPNYNNKDHTTQVMKYIFPKQFGLHNVFTSTVDPRETAQPFKDYTLREQEISQVERQTLLKLNSDKIDPRNAKQHLPKRLRGSAFNLVRKLQKLHSQCSYHELFKHYCPRPQFKGHERRKRTMEKLTSPATKTSMPPITQVSQNFSSSNSISVTPKLPAAPSNLSCTSLATPHSDVSAFCRAVLAKVIPDRFWGESAQGLKNKEVVMSHVDKFIRLRRFENMSLHTVCQRLKVNCPLSDHHLTLISADKSHSMVDAGQRKSYYKSLRFGHAEAQRIIPRISLLLFRLAIDPFDPLQFSCYGV